MRKHLRKAKRARLVTVVLPFVASLAVGTFPFFLAPPRTDPNVRGIPLPVPRLYCASREHTELQAGRRPHAVSFVGLIPGLVDM